METNNETTTTPDAPKPKQPKKKRKSYEYAAVYKGKGGRKLCAGIFKKEPEAKSVLRKLGVHKSNYLIEKVEKG
ncbi:hypothetical protein [Marinilabilia salmonicolor]|uniref:hypothetical protein n=1 Tax=Marinilabilia salmonicolor TaxID=989 RepID=UPI00029B2FC4|nr:hypothetical protein [Marinilabilia salmonicolor]